ncbi:MAG: 3-oxoacyl-ACP synthase [Anaerolineaceae bacterium]|nr:MAG: 3-oxoacyl-ACP synthase [Anaerolineaceae bacterium]
MTAIGIVGTGTYFPPTVQTAAEVAALTDIPASILQEKMGIRQRHIAGDGDSVSQMASHAAARAIESAGIPPERIKAVISHGSEYKDHIVWNAAGKIQHNVGAVNAFAFEMYALCAGAPIAMQAARGMMLADESLDYVLLSAASRENDLVHPRNERARFMFNFGAGAGAMVLKRGAERNLILGASAITDGSLSETVMLTREPDALGERDPINGDVYGMLDVQNAEYMAERLGESSLTNFGRVIGDAVAKSGATLDDVAFLGITHMKRSFYLQILQSVGLQPEQSVYLQDYGHVQSVDQVLALELGLAQGKIKDGDLIVLAGAGTGYTWSAVAVRWGAAR